MQDNLRDRFPEDVQIISAQRRAAGREFALQARILALLRKRGSLPVPGVAQELAAPLDEVTRCLMGLWRYNKVKASEKADEDGYYRYSLIEVK